MIETRKCSKCGEIKPLTSEYFYWRKDRQLFQAHCRICKNVNAYRYEQQSEVKARREEVRIANRDKLNAQSRLYYANHKDKHAAAVKSWCERNPDRVRAKTRRRRAKRLVASGTHTALDIQNQASKQTDVHGNLRCWWCNKSLTDKYHVDHVIPLSRGGSNGPENLVISCAYCNLSKGTKLPEEWRKNTRDAPHTEPTR